MPDEKPQVYEFDNFRLDARNRELLREGRSVALPAKAFDMLVVLIENSGRLVEKDELFRRVWPDQIVEESNLTVQVSAIRKALGERKGHPHYIATVPGHGYRFIGQIRSLDEEEESVVIERHSLSRITVETEQVSNSRASPNGNEGPATLLVNPAIEVDPLLAPSLSGSQVVESRNWRPVGIAILLLAALLSVALFFGFQKWRGDARRQAKAFPQPNITKLTTTFNVRDAALSPDGQYVLSVRSDNGIKSIWLGQTNASHSLQISESIDADIVGLTFAPDGKSLYYILHGADYPRQTLFKMSVTGGLARQILTHIGSPITFSPEGRRIAYIRSALTEGGNELVIADAESGAEQRVVARRGRQDYFSGDGLAWSPDGLTIALGQRDETGTPLSRLVSVSLDTGQSKVLTDTTWNDIGRVAYLADGSGVAFVARTHAAWTHQLWFLPLPNGKERALTSDVIPYAQQLLSVATDGNSLLALQMQNNYQLYVAPDDDATNARQIDLGAAGQQFPLFDSAWMPDGRIVYAVVSGESRALWLMNADGSNRRQLTPEGEVVRYPSVTRDGRYIIYQSARGGRPNIWRIAADGSNSQQLTTDGVSYHPHGSPDGRSVVYVSKKTGEERIWRLPAEGGEAVRLTDLPSNWPRVSPDGKWIACSLLDEKVSPRAQLAILPAAGGPPLKTFSLTKTGTFNDGVRWSSDSRSIIFRDYRFGIWRKPLTGEQPQPLKSFANLKIYDIDWSPDGKQMIYTSGSQVRVLTLVRDFR